MSALAQYDPRDLKLVYRVLHTQLMSETDLLDNALFDDLQTWLRSVAAAEGVDTSDHGQWDAWLHGKAQVGGPRLTLLKN